MFELKTGMYLAGEVYGIYEVRRPSARQPGSWVHVLDETLTPVGRAGVPLRTFVSSEPLLTRPERQLSVLSIVRSLRNTLLVSGLYEVIECGMDLQPVASFTQPWMLDLHHVSPWGERDLLVVNTGFDEVLQVDRDGNPRGFRWTGEMAGYPSCPAPRRLDNRGCDAPTGLHHEVHPNSAFRLGDGRVLISLLKEGLSATQGAILLVDEQGKLLNRLSHPLLQYAHCPIPYQDGFLACSSLNGTIVRFKGDGSPEVFVENVGFCKCIAEGPDPGIWVAGDATAQDLVVFRRGEVLRRVPLDFEPYWICKV